jgi:uncharacterized tellurite resistance protein B-like protein
MLKLWNGLLDALRNPATSAPEDPATVIRSATAVLLVEVMRADGTLGEAERRRVLQTLSGRFGLDAAASAELLARALDTARGATDLYETTSQLDTLLDMPAKLEIVEQMWAVAYADGQLDAHERHLLWRVADLLHVPHGAYVHARIRARDAAGAGGGPVGETGTGAAPGG